MALEDKPDFDGLRRQIASVEPHKKCPNCGMKCPIRFGRVSQMHFFYHPYDNDCVYNQIGSALFFKTPEAAMKAEKMFRDEPEKSL